MLHVAENFFKFINTVLNCFKIINVINWCFIRTYFNCGWSVVLFNNRTFLEKFDFIFNASMCLRSGLVVFLCVV